MRLGKRVKGKFFFVLLATFTAQSCHASGDGAVEVKPYVAPNGSVFVKAYLRQIIVQDQREFVSGHGITFSPTFLLDYVEAPYSLDRFYIGLKPGVVPGFTPSFYPDRQGKLDINATFYEIFVTDIDDIYFPNSLKQLEGSQAVKVSHNCLFYSGLLDGEERLVLFSELSLDKETALTCVTRAHLHYFGLKDLTNGDIFDYLKGAPTFTGLDYTLDFSTIRSKLNNLRKETGINDYASDPTIIPAKAEP